MHWQGLSLDFIHENKEAKAAKRGPEGDAASGAAWISFNSSSHPLVFLLLPLFCSYIHLFRASSLPPPLLSSDFPVHVCSFCVETEKWTKKPKQAAPAVEERSVFDFLNGMGSKAPTPSTSGASTGSSFHSAASKAAIQANKQKIAKVKSFF
jgi:hypothetical protein